MGETVRRSGGFGAPIHDGGTYQVVYVRSIGLIVLILALTIGVFVFATLWSTGQFKRLSEINMDRCSIVGGVSGAEDIALDEDLGLAFLSAFDRRKMAEDPDLNGHLYVMNLQSAEAEPIQLSLNNAPKNFKPHGIDLYRDETGVRFLYVINHPQSDQSHVEVFRLMSNWQLNHIKTIRDHPLMISMNDLIVVGKDEFYFTNDAGHADGWLKTIEQYLRLANSTVGYYGDGQVYRAAKGLVFANGIETNADGSLIFVAETTGQKLHVFRRSPTDNSLTRLSALPTGTNLDNLYYDSEGTLWIGSHPKILDLLAHVGDPAKPSPSQILTLRFLDNEQVSIATEFLSLGKELSGSSVAVRHQDTVLIGSVFEDKVLRCSLR